MKGDIFINTLKTKQIEVRFLVMFLFEKYFLI